MKVIFLGTPDFSATVLNKLYSSEHTVVAVVTQPDRIKGRNKKIVFSPVKEFALSHGIELLQFENINKEGEEKLKSLNADIMVTAAYGQILRANILQLCPNGIINVHASLLPKYRGASPVQWALINGEKTVGVTIMQTDIGIDNGDIITKKSINLSGEENCEEVLNILADIGGEAVISALNDIENKKATFTKQDEELATHCKMLNKEDGIIDFSKTAIEIKNFIRGVTPWPGAFCYCENGMIKIFKVEICSLNSEIFGTVLAADINQGLIISCKGGSVRILTIQGENSKIMDIKSYLLGKKLTVGSVVRGK